MTAAPLKLTIHMVSSLDGFIARKDNSISWFETIDHYEKGVAGENMEAFLRSINCYVMGAGTYEHALELSKSYGWPYGDTPTIVVSHRELPVDKQNIEIYAGDLSRLVHEKLKPKYKNVWLVGGPTLVKEFILLGLADEIRLSILPIMLGDGIPFLADMERECALHLKDVTAYKTGMVELWYELIKNRE